MKLRRLMLENYGPFKRYDLLFPDDESACILLTGKNNEGKTSILSAIRFVEAAFRAWNRTSLRITANRATYYRLPQQDTEAVIVGRLLHNYFGPQATIRAAFDDGTEVEVIVDDDRELIYSRVYTTRLKDASTFLGFMPPLGQLAEYEQLLTEDHVRKSLRTTLAPLHLRNHLATLLSKEEFSLVQELVEDTWPGIKLLSYELDYDTDTLSAFFREGRFDREVAWAGQGLQIWFQLITHLVRLRRHAVLVLDEPEIFLHAEKQNDLVHLLRENHLGCQLVATHSVELMNNVVAD